MSARDVSVAGELALLRQALAAAAHLLEPCAVGEELPPEAGQELLAVITLAEARVELLRRAVVGALDPALLRGRHNDVLGPRRTSDDPDVVLRAWRRAKEGEVKRGAGGTGELLGGRGPGETSVPPFLSSPTSVRRLPCSFTTETHHGLV